MSDLRRELEARLRAVVADLGDPILGIRDGEGVINGWGDNRVTITFATVTVTTARDDSHCLASRLRHLVGLETRRPNIALPWSITATRRVTTLPVADDTVDVELIESSSGAWVAEGLFKDRRFVIEAAAGTAVEEVTLVPAHIHFSPDGRAHTR